MTRFQCGQAGFYDVQKLLRKNYGRATKLRDTDAGWVAVAQKGVQAFVALAMGQKVPFELSMVGL